MIIFHYSSMVSSGKCVGTFSRDWLRQSTILLSHRHGCGHCGSDVHSDPVRGSTRPEHLNSCSLKNI